MQAGWLAPESVSAVTMLWPRRKLSDEDPLVRTVIPGGELAL